MTKTYQVIFSLLIAIAWFVSPLSAATSQRRTSEVADRVVALYNEGKFEEAELNALRALQSSEELPPVDQAILHRTLGFTYVAMEKEEKAKQQFLAWLKLDPLAELDSLYISPKIISVFRQAQRELAHRKAQNPPPDYAELNAKITAIKRSMIFPGLGQLYRGQQFKGFSLLTSEVILIGAFAYCQVQYDRSRNAYLQETDHSRMQALYDETNLYFRGKYAAAFLAAGVYLYSLFDILYLPPSAASGSTSFTLSPASALPTPLSLTLTVAFF